MWNVVLLVAGEHFNEDIPHSRSYQKRTLQDAHLLGEEHNSSSGQVKVNNQRSYCSIRLLVDRVVRFLFMAMNI